MNDGAALYVVAWLVVYPLLLVLALVVVRIGYQHVRERGKRAAYTETARRNGRNDEKWENTKR